LTPDAVATALEVSTKTVMRAIGRGELRASQLAERGCWRILPEDVDAWLELRANRPRELARGPRTGPIVPASFRVRTGASSRRGGERGKLRVPTTARMDA
jgi:excisionase family DNA binding protein